MADTKAIIRKFLFEGQNTCQLMCQLMHQLELQFLISVCKPIETDNDRFKAF